MHFKFTSFATPLPQEAAEFCVRYFGAQLLTHPDDFLAHRELAPEARAAGVRFFYTKSGWPPQGSGSPPHDPPRRRSFDIYFVHDPTKASSDILSVPNFNQYLHETHRFDLQENWDWYQVNAVRWLWLQPCSGGRGFARPGLGAVADARAVAGLALLPVVGQRGRGAVPPAARRRAHRHALFLLLRRAAERHHIPGGASFSPPPPPSSPKPLNLKQCMCLGAVVCEAAHMWMGSGRQGASQGQGLASQCVNTPWVCEQLLCLTSTSPPCPNRQD